MAQSTFSEVTDFDLYSQIRTCSSLKQKIVRDVRKFFSTVLKFKCNIQIVVPQFGLIIAVLKTLALLFIQEAEVGQRKNPFYLFHFIHTDFSKLLPLSIYIAVYIYKWGLNRR